MACLTVRDLSLGYGDRIILEGLNFSVSEGDYLCFFGRKEEYRYPEDYPNVEDEICVAGVFDIYEEETIPTLRSGMRSF